MIHTVTARQLLDSASQLKFTSKLRPQRVAGLPGMASAIGRGSRNGPRVASRGFTWLNNVPEGHDETPQPIISCQPDRQPQKKGNTKQ
jgi:hypothetical protein